VAPVTKVDTKPDPRPQPVVEAPKPGKKKHVVYIKDEKGVHTQTFWIDDTGGLTLDGLGHHEGSAAPSVQPSAPAPGPAVGSGPAAGSHPASGPNPASGGSSGPVSGSGPTKD